MTSVSNTSSNSPQRNNPPHYFHSFPVGGADPDFVPTERAKPALCSIPVLGKMLPQCK
ncbi:MAG TPA: hypothetical protein VIG82_08000 [Enteractinococcus sp.]